MLFNNMAYMPVKSGREPYIERLPADFANRKEKDTLRVKRMRSFARWLSDIGFVNRQKNKFIQPNTCA